MNDKMETMYDPSDIAVATYNKIADVYTRQYFTDFSDKQYIDIFLKKLPQKSRILDIGCGPGQFTQYMMDKGFRVTGIDYSKEMLAIAKKKVPKGDFRFADMRKIGFKKDSFDGLLVAYSLIHIPSIDVPFTLNGFHRILKPKGYIEIIVQKGNADQMIDEPFLPSEKMFFNFFTKKRISEYLKNSGFKVVYQLEADSLDPDSASDTVIYTIGQKI